jgi:hypothetical protein
LAVIDIPQYYTHGHGAEDAISPGRDAPAVRS